MAGGSQGAEVLKDPGLETVKSPSQVQTDLQFFFGRYISKLDPAHRDSLQQYLIGNEVRTAIERAVSSKDTVADTRFRIGCKIADEIAKDNPLLALNVLIKVHRSRFGETIFNPIDVAAMHATQEKEGWQKAKTLVNSVAFQSSAKAAAELPLQNLVLRTAEGDIITIKRKDDSPSKEIGLVKYYKTGGYNAEAQNKSFDNTAAYETAKGMLYSENLVITITKQNGEKQTLQSDSDGARDVYETTIKKILDPKTDIADYTSVSTGYK